MVLTHTFVICPNCGEKIEISDEDEEYGIINCFYCKELIHLADKEVTIVEEIY